MRKVYKYNPETDEVELVGTKGGTYAELVHMPNATGHSGHFFENLNCHIRDKNHKREVMKKMGVAEA